MGNNQPQTSSFQPKKLQDLPKVPEQVPPVELDVARLKEAITNEVGACATWVGDLENHAKSLVFEVTGSSCAKALLCLLSVTTPPLFQQRRSTPRHNDDVYFF